MTTARAPRSPSAGRPGPGRTALASFTFLAAFVLSPCPTPPARAQQPAVEDDDAPAAPARPDTAALAAAYHAERDDKKRARLVTDMGPGAAELLKTIVETDPSDEVALAAAYSLRRNAVGAVVTSLERRLATGARDAAAREKLERDIERHQLFAIGQNLPRFFREAPPPFTVKPDRRGNVRVLAFGDFGDGSGRQRAMAEAMQRYHAKKPFTFAVTVGDNFYPTGMSGPEDPRWDRDFKRLYGPMHIVFYPSLGNHDWYQTDSPAAEVLHSRDEPLWQLPATRYTFVAGPVQFFAIDTNVITRAELDWLDREVGKSTARWKIVYGHHPAYSDGRHGGDPAVHDTVLPLLRNRVDVYLCGHEHDLQHLAPDGGVQFAIVGGGGAEPRPVSPGPRSLFAASKNGFGVIEASKSTLTVTYVGADLQILHTFSLHR
jgi:hypothetical protein